MYKNLKLSIVVSFLVVFIWGLTHTNAKVVTFIYYQANETLYRIADELQTPEIVASNIPQTLIFSSSGNYAAFQNEKGVWLSEVANWKPELVVKNLPTQAFALYWTPDDTRLILRVWGVPSQISEPSHETLAYNLKTLAVEEWEWGNCDQIGRNRKTNNFALLCSVYTGLDNFQPQKISLEWGGNYEALHAEDYEILISDLVNTFPRPFNWSSTNSGQHLVFIDRNPKYDRANQDHSFWEIYSVWGGESISSLNSPRDPSIDRLISVSPNGESVAYAVRCNNEVCLQIANLKNGHVIWNDANTLHATNFYDIDWYPDNFHVAVLNGSLQQGQSIDVFNMQDGSNKTYHVGDSSGDIIIPVN